MTAVHEPAIRHRAYVAQVVDADGAQPTDCQTLRDARVGAAVGSGLRPGQTASSTATPITAALFDPTLTLAADILDDIERVRTANENRLRQITRVKADSDGQVRGFGLDPSHPDVGQLAAMVAAMLHDSKVVKLLGYRIEKGGAGCCLEHDAVKNLQRRLRRHPLGPWLKAQRGVGDKQAARLLAAIADPYIRPAYERDGVSFTEGPRTASALRKYCGLNGNGTDAAPKLHRGTKAGWNPDAKTRTILIVKSCIKQIDPHCRTDHTSDDGHGTAVGAAVRHLDGCACSPYRVVYDTRRAYTRTTHPEWPDGRSHSDGLRIAGQRLLLHLWREAKRLHEAQREAS